MIIFAPLFSMKDINKSPFRYNALCNSALLDSLCDGSGYLFMDNISGIYKVTSPDNKIYIGQSIDIKLRFKVYGLLLCKSQRKLYNSFIKYGVTNHKFEIIHECEPYELNILEKYYIQLYQSHNSNFGLNMSKGGNGMYNNYDAITVRKYKTTFTCEICGKEYESKRKYCICKYCRKIK